MNTLYTDQFYLNVCEISEWVKKEFLYVIKDNDLWNQSFTYKNI